MSNWGAAEIRALLTITAEKTVENPFTGTVKDGMLYEKVAEALGRRGYHRMKTQVTSKLKSLRRKFHQVCDHNKRTGRGRVNWEYFKVCQAIWGTSNSADPENVQGSLDITLTGSPTSNTSENADTFADEERAAAGSGEISPENLPECPESQTAPPSKKRRTTTTTTTKAQAVAEEIKDFLVNMDRKDKEKEKELLEREEGLRRSEREENKKRWEEEKAMREAEKVMRTEQLASLSNLFKDTHQGMQNEFQTESLESHTEQAPPSKKRKTTAKANAVTEEMKDFLMSMDRKDEEKEKERLEREEELRRSEREEDKKRWEEEKKLREAESAMRAEQFKSLSNLFRDMHKGMMNEFALLRETMSRLATPAAAPPTAAPDAPQYSTPHHDHPPVPNQYSHTLPSFNPEDPHSSSSPAAAGLDFQTSFF